MSEHHTLLTADERAFREAVRAFVESAVPRPLREKVASGAKLEREDYVGWQRILARRGWLTPGWPVEHGGTGWSVVQHYLFEETLAETDCPPVALTLGVGPKLVGPILCAYGTPEQQARFLPAIRAAEDWWCQGYSEPNAGSDLASLATRAVRDGDDYVVTGRKIWTSYAQWANRMACLVRTDPKAKPQSGISFLAVDMRHPGVTVRPIIGLNGRHFFNEVTLDEVRVPIADRIGPEHGGWTLAKALLDHERLGAARVAETKKRLVAIRADVVRGRKARSATLLRRLARLEIEARAIERMVMEAVARSRDGTPLSPAIAMLKVRGTELIQRLMDFHCEVLGTRAQIDERDAPASIETAALATASTRLYYRGVTIAAGTSEIQRELLARSLLQ